jgi:cytochrome c-type biogenesis protein CcmH
MVFAIVAALLTAAASLAVLAPLARGRPRALEAGSHDHEVYRDQLAELERDATRGLIGEAEAREARAEIARRLLASSADRRGQASERRNPAARVIAAAAVVIVPIVAWGIYGLIGSPSQPGQPLAARLADCGAQSSVEELVGCAQTHLASNPEDGRGWDVLAPIYLRMQRPADAVTAYANALRLLGRTPDRLAGYAEALAGASGGAVTAEAAAPLHEALAIDPRHEKARFMLAVAAAQAGQVEEAKAAWEALLADLAPDSPWRTPVSDAISEAGRRLAELKEAPGPTQADIDAAADLSAQDRTTMIESMVAGLDARLRADPGDGEGWVRLVRSYVVLGRPDDANAALARGLAALDPNGEAGRRLAALGRELDLGVTE